MAQNYYFDNAASSMPYPEVVKRVAETMAINYANPSSLHFAGQSSMAVIEKTREIAAKAIGANPAQICFTSSGTEANNMAMLGFCRSLPKPAHIITSAIEHSSLLAPASQLEKEGYRLTYLKPGQDGIISPRSLLAAITPDTKLVSIMHANNETGVVQDIAAMADIAHLYGATFHTDAIASFMKIGIDVVCMGIDMLSASGHKCYGPKGVGFLYAKDVECLEPLMLGGSHERGIRPGTLNVEQIAGLGEAIALCIKNGSGDRERIREIKQLLVDGIAGEGNGILINGSQESCLDEIVNFFVPGGRADMMLAAMDMRGLQVSAGAACDAGAIGPSHVISAMGRGEGGASIRFSIGRQNTLDEASAAVKIFLEATRSKGLL